MVTITTDAQWFEAQASFRWKPSLEDLTDVSTLTPGIFFHGSPDVNIREFSCDSGVFFTHSPTYAASYAVRRAHEGKRGGRIYTAKLITSNPYFPKPSAWSQKIWAGGVYDSKIEQDLINEAREWGYDSIVSEAIDATIFEIIVIKTDVIKQMHNGQDRLIDWNSSKYFDPLTLFRSNSGNIRESFPSCETLFSCQDAAVAANGSVTRVVVDAHNPIYCGREHWSQMDFDVLRFALIDCLVDPEDGGALVLQPDRIVAMNRHEFRAFKKNRRNWRGPARCQLAKN